MMKRFLLAALLGCSAMLANGQNTIALYPDSAKIQISKHIYGHFAEHLGRCIYGGIFVGAENDSIPQTDGVRNDVIEALKNLQIPNLRWPGGCFADIYHWKDAIGPLEQRKAIENMMWGHYREDNSFGTHEFLNMCELLDAEPYLAVNMNTGTVQEAVDWMQYVNHDGTGYMTDLREMNGREKPWKVTYWGIGNESWDCGGHMTVDYYINLYKRYATAMTDYYNSEGLYRIAVGPGFPDYNWTEELMKNIPARRFEGISIHHYAVNWEHKSSSYEFSDEEYFMILDKAWFMDEFIVKNSEVMDKYDPEKRVALVVDEWGGWYDPDPRGGSALYQQNTIRDAMIAGMTLNIFNNHADRVKMANLAQTVNVLQAVILTEGEKMLLTPTYHVMEMYKVHQDATLVPLQVSSADFIMNDQKLPAVSASASVNESGVMHISLTNIDISLEQEIEIDLGGYKANEVNGRILTSERIQDHNTFDNPEAIVPVEFEGAKLTNKTLKVTLPAHSVVVLELSGK